ncbi:GAF domain-containing protein [Haloplasma contractile]|uniref:Asparaginyl-tRNA synthetase protein n=1 Tax=Haloplasma contractile SSD-17B TaxID=1033810 RepID=U2FRP4_9MOLU|nr:GAF domain-containing protein [Haloplasma contractile]ERJ13634.1 asparaginyl-tRNA synthetase protein [Haloplasma contractile SSD-17B]
MFQSIKYPSDEKKAYELLNKQFKHLIEGEDDLIANLSNASALLNFFLKDINWVGFYLNKNEQLVLGPFQGLPACIRIPLKQGVCGYAARTKKTVIVDDVHCFPGHIACDSQTNSEIVIPMLDQNQNLIGVLDIDSPKLSRFSATDRLYLEEFVTILMSQLKM